MMTRQKFQAPPPILYLYVAGILLLGLWSLIPSEVETTYTWQGAALLLALIGGLVVGSHFCRWVLILVGAAASLGSLLLQTDGQLEFVATMWSVLAMATTVLLLTPSMRNFTESDRQRGEARTADVAPSGRPLG
jgi:hypothetical protein